MSSELKFPIDFTEKAKQPGSANGTGYPYRISANDLMRDFHYAALVAEEGWIESDTGSLYDGRKLKFPKIPEGSANKYYILAANAGDLEFLEFEMIEVSICQNNEEKTGKILFRGTA
jgi:hypothetical protein